MEKSHIIKAAVIITVALNKKFSLEGFDLQEKAELVLFELLSCTSDTCELDDELEPYIPVAIEALKENGIDYLQMSLSYQQLKEGSLWFRVNKAVKENIPIVFSREYTDSRLVAA